MYIHKGGECLKHGRKQGKVKQLQSLQLSLVKNVNLIWRMVSNMFMLDNDDKHVPELFSSTTTLLKYLVRFKLQSNINSYSKKQFCIIHRSIAWRVRCWTLRSVLPWSPRLGSIACRPLPDATGSPPDITHRMTTTVKTPVWRNTTDVWMSTLARLHIWMTTIDEQPPWRITIASQEVTWRTITVEMWALPTCIPGSMVTGKVPRTC